MRKHWMIVLALLVFAVGCNQKQKAEEAAQQAAQNAKVAEAVKKQKRGVMTKPEEGPGTAPAEDAAKDDAAKATDDATESKETKDDAGTESEEKTETSSKINAKTVLEEALAAAKADDKALFVHFTAQW